MASEASVVVLPQYHGMGLGTKLRKLVLPDRRAIGCGRNTFSLEIAGPLALWRRHSLETTLQN